MDASYYAHILRHFICIFCFFFFFIAEATKAFFPTINKPYLAFISVGTLLIFSSFFRFGFGFAIVFVLFMGN